MTLEKLASPVASPVVESTTWKLRNGKVANPWIVLLSLVLGLFMALLDATIVNIAFTAIQAELHSDSTTTSWVLNSYSLAFAVLLVTAGRLADQFGRKKVFMIGMVLFSLGSLLCAVAPTIEWLIGFRALQAIGASALNPVSLAIITVVFPPQKRGAAIGLWGALTGLAMGFGPVIGGFLVTNFAWQSIFYVNLPFCVVGLVMVWLFVPENKDPRASTSIDYLGTIFLSASLFCLILGITEGNNWGWGSTGILALFGGSLLTMGIFVMVEMKQENPLLDLKLFKIRSFMASNLAMGLFGIGVQAALLILVFYYIMTRGLNQLDAAYALLPMPAAGFLASGFFGMFSRKANLRIVGMVGLSLSSFGLLLLSMLGDQPDYLDIVWRSVFIGIGLGLCFMTYSTIVLSEVPQGKVGVGSGTFNTFRQIGFALGIAIMISFYSGQLKDKMVLAKAEAIKIVQTDPAVPANLQQFLLDGLNKMGNPSSQMGEKGGSSSTNFDLSTMVDNVPSSQMPDSAKAAIKPQLKELNGTVGLRINSAFSKAMSDSFSATWLLGGLLILIGLVPGAFARHKRA